MCAQKKMRTLEKQRAHVKKHAFVFDFPLCAVPGEVKVNGECLQTPRG